MDLENPSEARKQVDHLLATNRVVLFMKGHRLAPSCAFSAQAVRLLDKHGVPYATFDVQADPAARAAVREVADWEAFPQLFIEKRFVGGYDGMLVLDQTGALAAALAGAPATPTEPAEDEEDEKGPGEG